MSSDTKKELAAKVQKFVLSDLEMLLNLSVEDAVKWEATAVSPLVTQVRIWPETGGPRYFNVKVSEVM